MDELLDRRHTGMMLAVVFFATFMDGIDGSIVNVALPDIGSGFGVDTATVSWISITYMMVLAGTLVAFAKVAEDIGVRPVMVTGLTIFTVGSLLCGISPSFGILVAARAVQAVGAGMMAATGPMCCVKHLPASKLAFGLSIVTIGASVGFALGPALGGIIVDYVSWHWIFLINLPIGAVAIPLMLMAIPRTAERKRLSLDVMGTVALFLAITLITFGVETLSEEGMRIYSAITLVLGIALLPVFARIEHRSPNPLLKLTMFRRFDFTSIFICLMLINMVVMGILYLIPFYGQICLGKSSSEIGLFLLSSAMVTAILGLPVGRLSDRYGRRPFCILAGIFCAASFAIFVMFADKMDDVLLLTSMILIGLSWACVGGPMASRLVEHAKEDPAMASSLTNEAYYIGGAVGTAAVAMFFAIFSGTSGIDILEVSRIQFVEGLTCTAAILVALALLIATLSVAVKDED